MRLGDVLKDLQVKTFTGYGVSEYYPKDSDNAYYRMLYSPARMELRHKSPWGSPEELVLVQYEENDMEPQTIEFLEDGKHYKTISVNDTTSGNEENFGVMVKYLFKDPRFALRCAEDIKKLPAEEPGECHAVTVFNTPVIKVVCDFFTDNDYRLARMYIHKFLLGKEILSQNMDVIFSMPR